MKYLTQLSFGVIALAALSACTTPSSDPTPLALARSEYLAARNNPQTVAMAANELQTADIALQRAERAEASMEPAATVDHLAYLARQRATIAQEVGRQKTAERRVSEANTMRDRMQLEARTQEADAARQQMRMAQGQTRSAQDQTRASEMRNRELEAQIKELNAQATPRGWVITMGDVVFGSGLATLKSGSVRNLDKLVEFLQKDPQRNVVIEGFTDSTGSEASNLALSRRRSEAVRSELMRKGVNPQRISTQGYGEAYPVASNDTASGRQMNRRVEIIVSNESGVVPAR
jgi:outer membrane protein OmpA-like peptidoglycan-associated protein